MYPSERLKQAREAVLGKKTMYNPQGVECELKLDQISPGHLFNWQLVCIVLNPWHLVPPYFGRGLSQ